MCWPYLLTGRPPAICPAAKPPAGRTRAVIGRGRRRKARERRRADGGAGRNGQAKADNAGRRCEGHWFALFLPVTADTPSALSSLPLV
jgi:hypothetical protein